MKLLTLLPLLMLTGCLADDRYARTVDDYALAAHGVDLGMTPAQVANILQPTQDRLEQHARRSPEQYISNGQALRASPDHPHAANFHWVQIVAPEQRRLSLH